MILKIILIIVICVGSVLLYDNTQLRIDNEALSEELDLKIQHYEWLSEITNELVYGDADKIKDEINEFRKKYSIDPQT